MPFVLEEVTCVKLQQPENGFISGYQTKVGSIVAFECAEGFELKGSAFRKCLTTGEWDGEPAKCQVRDCGQPPEIPNAVLKFSSTTYNSKVYFDCKPGTKASIPNPHLVCGRIENRTTWLPFPYPSCYKDCSVPHIENASISLIKGDDVTQGSPLLAGAVLKYGAVIAVRCESGYSLTEGKNKFLKEKVGKIVCLDGSWSRQFQCMPSRCTTRPPNIERAITRFYGFHHGSIVHYQCFPGYALNTTATEAALRKAALTGAPASTWALTHDRYSVKCDYGTWKGELPSCVQVQCDRPPVPEGMEIHIVGSRGRWPFDSRHILPTHGAVVEYSCLNDDFRIEGPKFTVCVDGFWSPNETPNCTRITHDVIPPTWLFYKP